jgi:hypothetical protein
MSTGVKSFSTLATALVLFGLAGSAIAVTVPHLFTGPERPGFTLFLTAGAAVIALTAGLFGYIDRLGMGFGKTTLVLAAGYNSLIAAVKLGLAPAALYEANQEQSFDAFYGDPNSPLFYVGVGVVVLFLYAVVFRAMYVFFTRRFRRRADVAPEGRANGRSADRVVLVRALLGVVGVAILGFFLWWVPVMFVALPASAYFSYVFATFGAVIALALLLAAVLAYRAFDEVEKQAVRLGEATLLANFFWLGLVLIVLYHAMWAVFLLALVSIWPFQTYTPK